MILAALEDQMRARGRATAADLAEATGADKGAVGAMLDLLVRKGRVQPAGPVEECGGGACGTGACRACPLAATRARAQVFEWVG